MQFGMASCIANRFRALNGRHGAKLILSRATNTIKLAVQSRSLLSATFQCNDEWKKRLSEPALSTVSADLLIPQLFIQFEKNSAATAVDMEVFANKVHDVHPTQLHLVESLLKRFRKSVQASSVIDSMSHAIIRAYLQLDQASRLVSIIQQKVDFGLFPDDFANCLLLDHFIESGNLLDSSKVAIEMMLQEDFGHPTARVLALHACSLYLGQSKADLLAPFTEDDKPTLDDEEEEYVVVKFIPLHNFDDHFDVTDEKRQIGKTLDLVSSCNSDPVYSSYKLIGLAMREDMDTLFTMLETHLEQADGNTSFHREVLDILSLCVEACRFKSETIEREPGTALKEDSEYNARHSQEDRQRFINKFQELRPRLESSSLLDTSLLADCKALATKEVQSRLETDFSDYKSQLEKWSEQRTANVRLQERAFTLKGRQESLQGKLKELAEKEELLHYFVRQNEISLGLLRANKLRDSEGEVDLTDYVAEPGKRGKKGKLG